MLLFYVVAYTCVYGYIQTNNEEQRKVTSLSTSVPSWMDDGWMTYNFKLFLTVLQSYRDDVWMIMEGCVQWNRVYYWKDSISSGSQIRDCLTRWPTLNLLSYQGSSGDVQLSTHPSKTNKIRYRILRQRKYLLFHLLVKAILLKSHFSLHKLYFSPVKSGQYGLLTPNLSLSTMKTIKKHHE